MRLHQKLFLLLIFLSPLQLGRHFWPHWSYIYGLKIDYLSPTLYLTDLIILGILASWGWEKLRRRITLRKDLIPPILILIFFLINACFAQNQGAAFYKLIKIVEFSLFWFYVVKNAGVLFPFFTTPLRWAVIYSSLIATAQFIRQSSLGGIFWWLGERTFSVVTPGIAKAVWQGRFFLRPYATFSHPNSLAGFVLVGFLLTLPHLLKRNNFLLSVVYCLLSIVCLFLCFSRIVWLISLILIFVFLASVLLKSFYKSFFLLLVLIVGLGLLGQIILPDLMAGNLFKEESFARRIVLNEKALVLVKQSPFIGVGLNNFIPSLVRIEENYGWTYWWQPVHNIYWLVASETGLIGLTIFLLLLFKVIKKIFINNLNPENRLLTISFLVIIFLGFFDHYWLTLQQNQILATVILGLIIGIKKRPIF